MENINRFYRNRALSSPYEDNMLCLCGELEERFGCQDEDQEEIYNLVEEAFRDARDRMLPIVNRIVHSGIRPEEMETAIREWFLFEDELGA